MRVYDKNLYMRHRGSKVAYVRVSQSEYFAINDSEFL